MLVAQGRDYADVPPLKGIYAGGGASQDLGVDVEIRTTATLIRRLPARVMRPALISGVTMLLTAVCAAPQSPHLFPCRGPRVRDRRLRVDQFCVDFGGRSCRRRRLQRGRDR